VGEDSATADRLQTKGPETVPPMQQKENCWPDRRKDIEELRIRFPRLVHSGGTQSIYTLSIKIHSINGGPEDVLRSLDVNSRSSECNELAVMS
jgi:hypothetical protein